MKNTNQQDFANHYSQVINNWLTKLTPQQCWQKALHEILVEDKNFAHHLYLYQTIYPDWEKEPAPAWFPEEEAINKTNIAELMRTLNINDYPELHRWSVENFQEFWRYVIDKLKIKFHKPYKEICDLSNGFENPTWLPGAKLNIVESCFTATDSKQDKTAIIYQAEQGEIKKVSYKALERLANRVANSLVTLQYEPGDPIAIDMPMNIEAIAIYLGIIKAGCIVVGIADSFSADEIQTRLNIAKAKAIFTQDFILRGNKKLPLYEKVVAANAPQAIVLSYKNVLELSLRETDLSWQDFLVDNDDFVAVSREPHDTINILFSSGTTGTPKAIPWVQTTPIKSASDAYFHHNIQPDDVLAWPINLGWMMGPWLVFASLLNQSTIALYDGLPTDKAFGQFVEKSKVNMLGVVPTLVKSWRTSGCMEDCDWSAIKCFSSTGECSNSEDMLYLMYLAGYRPIIEYCGGTEIGGGYITGTLVQPCAPATFTTPTLGLDFTLIDEEGKPTNNGEVAIIPPSIGLSNELLNRDHHEVYYANMPKTKEGQLLRRHGDQIEKINKDYYRALGRVDDTMNLGGMKTSAAEIERVLGNIVQPIREVAAIAVSPNNGGPAQLIIFAVLEKGADVIKSKIKDGMQQAIKEHLNPLFKIHDVLFIDALPRTASNKVMRRVLRDKYNVGCKM